MSLIVIIFKSVREDRKRGREDKVEDEERYKYMDDMIKRFLLKLVWCCF